MNKNTTIGVLVVIILIGLGYYLTRGPDMPDTTQVTVTPTVDTSPAPVVTPGTPSLKPDAPIVQTGSNTSTSNSTAAVTGQVKPNGASTTYWFEYGDSQALGNRSTTQAIGSGYTSIPTPGFITGLKANTLYYYRLSAKNSIGTVNGSTLTFQTNNTAPVVGKAPTTRTNAATTIARSTAVINGQVNPNGSPTSYWFEYGTDTNFGSVTQFLATNSGTTFMTVAASISGLEPGMKYYFRLNGQNQYGTVNGATMSFTTVGPAAPSAPKAETTSASSINATSATLNGRVNPGGADTTYWFEYSDDSLLNTLIGSGTPHQSVSAGNTTVAVNANTTGLHQNTKYYYHLVAQNSQGTVYGSIQSFTTQK
jgi:phosphodiesterase/alkaline phosphatase D-like protein